MSRFGLKISPYNCPFIRDHLTYMGLILLLKDEKSSYMPMKHKWNAIIMTPPRSVKEWGSHYGIISVLSSIFKDLRKHLIPIFEIQKNKNKLKWTEENQKAFEHIKDVLITSPVLQFQKNEKFTSEGDSSETVEGAALF